MIIQSLSSKGHQITNLDSVTSQIFRILNNTQSLNTILHNINNIDVNIDKDLSPRYLSVFKIVDNNFLYYMSDNYSVYKVDAYFIPNSMWLWDVHSASDIFKETRED